MRESVEEYLKSYGRSLREQRLRSKLTQLKVARSLGISQAIISHIETGRMLPTIEIEEELFKLYARRYKNEQTLLL